MIFVTQNNTGTMVKRILETFLENIKLFSGSPGKINFQVCGNPEKCMCEECLSSNMT